eukprot:6210572-Pleurochrysis_carterae.AAC.3
MECHNVWFVLVLCTPSPPLFLLFFRPSFRQGTVSPAFKDTAHELRAKLLKARAWADRLAGDAGRPTLREATALLADIEADDVLVPSIGKLRALVAAGKAWVEQARGRVVERTKSPSLSLSLPRALFLPLRSLTRRSPSHALSLALPLTLSLSLARDISLPKSLSCARVHAPLCSLASSVLLASSPPHPRPTLSLRWMRWMYP